MFVDQILFKIQQAKITGPWNVGHCDKTEDHYENKKYTEKITTKKWKLSDKNSDIFHISAQNVDCGYLLEPPRRGSSNEYPHSMFWAEIRSIMYTPVNPSFTI